MNICTLNEVDYKKKKKKKKKKTPPPPPPPPPEYHLIGSVIQPTGSRRFPGLWGETTATMTAWITATALFAGAVE